MKKSNKLLLGGLLTVILVIAGIHIALYAKYKNGNYTLYHRAQAPTDNELEPFENIKLVRIQNVFSVTIRLGDVTSVERGKEGEIQYQQTLDSLIITGQYNRLGQQDKMVPINITLPYNSTIVADSISRIIFQSNDFLKSKITIVPNNP